MVEQGGQMKFAEKRFVLRKLGNEIVNVYFRPTSVLAGMLSIGIIYVLLSVLGINVLSGNKLVLLSTATSYPASVSAPSPKTVIFEAEQDDEAHVVEVSEWRNVRMRVTAYCACRRCCGKYANGRTASNHRIRRGDVFVASDKKYRFGTKMVIPGYNNSQAVKVLDRGRVIKGNRLDVFIPSHRRARKWGVKYLDVQVKI
jgi:3D (Asp-Asp-Asp) domain-containing protein